MSPPGPVATRYERKNRSPTMRYANKPINLVHNKFGYHNFSQKFGGLLVYMHQFQSNFWPLHVRYLIPGKYILFSVIIPFHQENRDQLFKISNKACSLHQVEDGGKNLCKIQIEIFLMYCFSMCWKIRPKNQFLARNHEATPNT